MIDVKEEQIKLLCKQLKLPTFANYRDILRQSQSEADFSDLLLDLLMAETNARQENQNRRRLKAAGFPFQKTLDEFDFSQLRNFPVAIKRDVGASSYWSEMANMQTLDNLRANGTLEILDYLERIPDKLIPRKAELIEPLEEVVDGLKEQLRQRHIKRLQKGECTIEMGFILNDLLNNYSRISDHCSNVAVAVIEVEHNSFDTHKYLNDVKYGSADFAESYQEYSKKYAL